MSQSLAKLLVHLVFSTKHRIGIIDDRIRSELYAYSAGILTEHDSCAIQIGGTDDHVHIFFQLSKNLPLIKVIEELKKGSSKWIKTKGGQFQEFFWQRGYGAFSVSQSNSFDLIQYIQKQKEHHRKKTFQEEYRELLEKFQIPFDERFVWD